MQVDEMLQREILRLYKMEGSLVAVYDRIDGLLCSRRAAVVLTTLIDSADRHLSDLERTLEEQGWSNEAEEPMTILGWRVEMEERVLAGLRGVQVDATCLALLSQAVHFKIPCYESARLFALYSERPMIARDLRLALQDEFYSLDRLRSAAEFGVSLRSAMSGGLF